MRLRLERGGWVVGIDRGMVGLGGWTAGGMQMRKGSLVLANQQGHTFTAGLICLHALPGRAEYKTGGAEQQQEQAQ